MEVLYDKENVILLGCKDINEKYRVEIRRKIGELLTSYLTVDEVRIAEDPEDGTEWSQYYYALKEVTKVLLRLASKSTRFFTQYGEVLIRVYQKQAEKYPLLMFYMEEMIEIVCQFILERKPPSQEWVMDLLLDWSRVNWDKFEVYRCQMTEIPDERKVEMCREYCDEIMLLFCRELLSVKEWAIGEIGLLNEIRKKHPRLDEDSIRCALSYKSCGSGAYMDYSTEPQNEIQVYTKPNEHPRVDDITKFKVYHVYHAYTLFDILTL